MKIRALTRDKGGCRYYRLETPLRALAALGHDTGVSDRITGADIMESDVLIVQFINGPEDIGFLEDIASMPKRPLLVYEVDDDLFTIDHVLTPEMRGGKEVIWAKPDTQARVKHAMGLCDLVTVTTPHLARMYAPYAKRTAVLPNAIPDFLLDVPRETSDKFTIGWTLSASHLLDAREHIEALDRFMRRRPSARFHWIGQPQVVGGFPRWQQRCFTWDKDVETYLNNLGQKGMHVGIAPLGNYEFNLGKSGIKADEYAALGLPTIASDFPQYRETITHGETGYLIRTKTEWGAYLSRLMDDPHLRQTMGKQARENVSARTISKTCQRWVDAYEEALDERDR